MENLALKLLQEEVALRRDQKAYKELFLHFYGRLAPFAATVTKSSVAAEEIVSDVMLNIWQLEERLLAVEDLRIYLFRATKNRALNYLNRNRTVTSLDAEKVEARLYDESPNPFELLQRAEMRRCLSQAIKSLPPRCGMVYHLVKEQGLTYREAAGVMAVSENTVDRQLNNALHKLIKAFALYLDEAPPEKNRKGRMGKPFEKGVLTGDGHRLWNGSHF